VWKSSAYKQDMKMMSVNFLPTWTTYEQIYVQQVAATQKNQTLVELLTNATTNNLWLH
jgi:hypothetical protein